VGSLVGANDGAAVVGANDRVAVVGSLVGAKAVGGLGRALMQDMLACPPYAPLQQASIVA